MIEPSGLRPTGGLIPRLPLRGICICTLSCVSEAPSVSGAGARLPPLNVGIVPVGNKPNSTGFGASLPMRRAISASMLYLPVEPSCVRGVRGTPRRFLASSKANLPRAPAAPTAPSVPRVPSPPMPGPPVSKLPKRCKRPGLVFSTSAAISSSVAPDALAFSTASFACGLVSASLSRVRRKKSELPSWPEMPP